MRDLGRMASDNQALPSIGSDQTDLDFAVYVGTRYATQAAVTKLLDRRKDPRVIVWTPAELTQEERDRLVDFAAYRKLISDWQGKETEDAVAVINWVANALQADLAKIVKIVDNSYARGRIDALNNTQMEFRVAGELAAILTPLVDKVLTAAYESRDIKFEPPFVFRKEEGVKVINGIVRTGRIPKGAKPNQNISAAQNFGFGLNIMKKGAEKELDVSGNIYVQDMWSFIDDKLTDDGQTMRMDTLYKNFMGIGGPKDYGLTRRMVQIYLLCLVREGRVRIAVGPKGGLPSPLIDYSNVADVDFSTKVLDSFVEIQKVTKPENWEILRPYAEKLLGVEIPSTHDDAVISEYRAKLRQLFAEEKEASSRTAGRAQALFEVLKISNPYETELGQVVKLFSVDIEGGDDINLVLYALKEAMGYQAFDTNVASLTEVDDLANRLRNYHDLRAFLGFETEIRTAHSYCGIMLPDSGELKATRKALSRVRDKLGKLQAYIDSDVKLKTELIGHAPPIEGETGTISVMIQQYASVYAPMHDSVVSKIEDSRNAIADILDGRDIKAFGILEGITALQPATTEKLKEQLEQLKKGLFECPSPSRSSVEEQLRIGPLHECGLSFATAVTVVQAAEQASVKAKALLDQAFQRKMEVFVNPAIRERLEQGKSEPVIAGLLACKDTSEIREYLVEAVEDDPGVIDVINRYLKRIIVKRIRMTDFKPKVGTIQKGQVGEVVKEFRQFLDTQFEDIDADDDSLPMLQME